MRILTQQFDPSIQQFDLPIMQGAQVLSMRMSVHGHCEVITIAEDEDTEATTVPVMILREDIGNQGGGSMADWRHVGTWRYMSGTIAHGFVSAKASPAKRAKRTASPVDTGDAGQ